MYGLPSRSQFLAQSDVLAPIEFYNLEIQRRRVWASAEFVMAFEIMKQWQKDRDQYATQGISITTLMAGKSFEECP